MYQVLARKWRPKVFPEVVGQEHVLRALTNALEQKRLHHAYLFTGTRGVGKTTIARILAKCLNCNSGVTATPCGVCDGCVEIDAGRFIDLIEVDAASRTKVEDTRDLLDNVQYLPVAGRYKIYIIDEVHMLSNHSFNALLKTLEEPPAHVKFLLATTDPQKLPVTILSRCLQFNLKRLSPDCIKAQLGKILNQEQITFEDQALLRLAVAADGSVRDALSLLDQAIAYGGGSVKASDVCAMLGSIENTYIFQLLEGLINKDANHILNTIAELAACAADFVGVLDELLSILHQLAVVQLAPNVLSNSFEDAQQIREFAAKFTADEIQLYYQIGLIGRRDLSLAPTPKIGFEMAMLRMLAFRPQSISMDASIPIANRISGLAQIDPSILNYDEACPQLAPGVHGLIHEERGQGQQQSCNSKNEGYTGSQSSVINGGHKKEGNQKESALTTKANDNLVTMQAKSVSKDGLNIVGKDNNNHNGNSAIITSIIAQLKLSGPTAVLLKNCMLASIGENHADLLIAPAQSPLLNKNSRERVNAAFSEFFGKPIRVEITVGSVDMSTPAKVEQQKLTQQQEEVMRTLTSDPNVQRIIDAFDAKLIMNGEL